MGGNGQNLIIRKLESMKHRVIEKKTKDKYDKTIKFLESNYRIWQDPYK